MRLHTNEITLSDINAAAKVARVSIETSTHGSRSRDRAFNVKLEGESKRRPNGGASGAGTGYAATWDQWGVFFGMLFDVDPEMKCWAYDGADDFHHKTNYRFEEKYTDSGLETYWPEDAHGDHRFDWQGVPREQSCKKCTAVRRW